MRLLVHRTTSILAFLYAKIYATFLNDINRGTRAIKKRGRRMTTVLGQCSNQACDRTFILHRFSHCFAIGEEVGKTRCPYCGSVRWLDPSHGYRAEVLPPEPEEWLKSVAQSSAISNLDSPRESPLIPTLLTGLDRLLLANLPCNEA